MTDRTKRIEFRCTEEEKDLLERAAKASGLETGSWVRAMALAFAEKRNQIHAQWVSARDRFEKGGK